MRSVTAFLALTLCLVLTPTALGAENEEIMLKDGFTAMVEVVETGPEHVTVKFVTKDGKAGQTKLHANALDPHCFYDIRRRHMEKTVENHVKLAVFCVSAGLFRRARGQMDAARAIDPDVDKKIEAAPEIMEGIANHLAEAARRHHESHLSRGSRGRAGRSGDPDAIAVHPSALSSDGHDPAHQRFFPPLLEKPNEIAGAIHRFLYGSLGIIMG